MDKLLSAQQEVLLARRIEAGLFAQELLTHPTIEPGDATNEELQIMVVEGEAARESFLLANVGLVRSLAIAEAKRRGLDADELFQEGFLGLLDALQRWDYRRGTKFSTLATPLISHAISRAAASRLGQLHLSPSQAKQLSSVRAAQHRLESSGQTSTAIAIAEQLGKSEAWTAQIMNYERPSSLINFDIGYEDDAYRYAGIRPALAALPPRQREVLWLRMGFSREPMSLQAISKKLGCSIAMVKKLQTQAIEQLREHPHLVVDDWVRQSYRNASHQ